MLNVRTSSWLVALTGIIALSACGTSDRDPVDLGFASETSGPGDATQSDTYRPLLGQWRSDGCAAPAPADNLDGECTTLRLGSDGSYDWIVESDILEVDRSGEWAIESTIGENYRLRFSPGHIKLLDLTTEGILFDEIPMRLDKPEQADLVTLGRPGSSELAALLTSSDAWYREDSGPKDTELSFRPDGTASILTSNCRSEGVWTFEVGETPTPSRVAVHTDGSTCGDASIRVFTIEIVGLGTGTDGLHLNGSQYGTQPGSGLLVDSMRGPKGTNFIITAPKSVEIGTEVSVEIVVRVADDCCPLEDVRFRLTQTLKSFDEQTGEVLGDEVVLDVEAGLDEPLEVGAEGLVTLRFTPQVPHGQLVEIPRDGFTTIAGTTHSSLLLEATAYSADREAGSQHRVDLTFTTP